MMEHSVLLASQCGSWSLILWLQVNEGYEELDVPDTMEDRTKLLTDMQKDNQQLRLQLARLHQKFLLAQQGSLSMQDSPWNTANSKFDGQHSFTTTIFEAIH